MPETTQPDEHRRQKEQANVVATAACLLSDMELAERHYEQAMEYANIALQAGNRISILRRAAAYGMLGRIYGAMHHEDQAEQAYRNALRELEKTERIGVRISTHVRFGSYLLSIGKREAGQRELEIARLLSETASFSNGVLVPCDALVPERGGDVTMRLH